MNERTNERTNIRTDEQKDKNYKPLGINAGGIKIANLWESDSRLGYRGGISDALARLL